MAQLAYGTLNRARYAGLDFDTHYDDLLARLQVKYASDFNDFAISSLGIMLLDLTAYGLDTLSFYLDRRATDTYLATARTRKSVSRTSRQLGYKMGGAVASSVDMLVKVTEVFAFDVPIPARFQFNGPNGLIFETAEATTFLVSEQGVASAGKYIPAYEGETITESFVSDGTPAQVFELRRVPADKFVVQGTVEVAVDGADWDVVDLLEYGQTDQFEVGFNDDPPTLRFGDGIAGNIPIAGASIDVTYVASRGKAGQVSSGSIQEETTSLVVAFTEIPLSITNPEGSSGGDDRETLASAKAFAPQVWKSAGKAVTGEDYAGLAGSYADSLFGRVAVAKAISSRSSGGDLTVQNYLTDILNGITILTTALTTATGNITTALDAADVALASLASTGTEIASEVSDIETAATSARSQARVIKNKVGEITVDAADIAAYVTAGLADGTLAGKDGYFNLINTEATNIDGSASSIQTAADSIVGYMGDTLTAVEMIGTDGVTADTLLKTMLDDVAVLVTSGLTVRSEAGDIDTENTDLLNLVDTSIDAINAHLDRVLASDCKANLVTVPILTRDAGGFYTAPSIGLIDSLQSFLDARKEVTQTVAVTSGENFLIPAVIRARIGVFSGYSETVVKTAVVAAIEGVLRDRQFGVSLYESDLDDVILEVEGVAFVNARIDGHIGTGGSTSISNLDADGNLILSDSEVITRGSVTVTTEAYTT